MTTGRINQVTTIHLPTKRSTIAQYLQRSLSACFPEPEFIDMSWLIQLQPCFCFLCFRKVLRKTMISRIETPCSPISQISDMSTLVQWTSRRQSSVGTTNSRQYENIHFAQPWRIPKWLRCDRFSYQQVIHIRLQCKLDKRVWLWLPQSL